jgi:coenzyme F420-reducing hydrogenase delta subunit
MQDSSEITMFVCANCARPARAMSPAGRTRPVVPDFDLPGGVRSIVVPCTGRLQPEHILRAFEAGSRVVGVVACREGNCHYGEGSRRCALRADYVRSILNEIGLGDGRLLISYLPGSASEDLALASGSSLGSGTGDSLQAQLLGIRSRILEALRTCPPNPLKSSVPAAGKSGGGESATGDDDDDE